MGNSLTQPVISGVRYFLAHTPNLVRYGSKPYREISKDPSINDQITAHLRTYSDASSYPPNQAFLGSLYPDDLWNIERPWFQVDGKAQRSHPHGEIMPEEELYGILKISDSFDLVWLEEDFTRNIRRVLEKHPFIHRADLEKLGHGQPYSAIEAQVTGEGKSLPLFLNKERMVGCINRAHEQDPALSPSVLLENLVCKSTATMALRTLLSDLEIDPSSVEYVVNCGEEAVGERYQRGGGNLAKAIGEMCGLSNSTGSDVKAFCCAPTHALLMAGTLISSGVFKKVIVVGGCSLAKLGMKFQGHMNNHQPILEDVLAAVAINVEADDGKSPVIRLDSIGRHTVGAGSSQQAIFEKLISDPLKNLGLKFHDIDKYATELHNPEVTEPSGSGDVPKRNFQLIGALAVVNKEIAREELPLFVKTHGMPGFSPTQGHIASALPFLGHAIDHIRNDKMERVMLLAKGSLFLGRMTQMSDGLSFILEGNPSEKR